MIEEGDSIADEGVPLWIGRFRRGKAFCPGLKGETRGTQPLGRGIGALPFCEHRFDSAQRLPRALFVFDEREADVAVTVVAETDAG